MGRPLLCDKHGREKNIHNVGSGGRGGGSGGKLSHRRGLVWFSLISLCLCLLLPYPTPSLTLPARHQDATFTETQVPPSVGEILTLIDSFYIHLHPLSLTPTHPSHLDTPKVHIYQLTSYILPWPGYDCALPVTT